MSDKDKAAGPWHDAMDRRSRAMRACIEAMKSEAPLTEKDAGALVGELMWAHTEVQTTLMDHQAVDGEHHSDEVREHLRFGASYLRRDRR